MNAELSAELRAAASEAESILGETFLYNGQRYTGVFGAANISDVLNASGGYTRKAMVQLTATRSQFDSNPSPKQGITRISPRIDYLVDAIDTHDPLHFTFMLVKNGA